MENENNEQFKRIEHLKNELNAIKREKMEMMKKQASFCGINFSLRWKYGDFDPFRSESEQVQLCINDGKKIIIGNPLIKISRDMGQVDVDVTEDKINQCRNVTEFFEAIRCMMLEKLHEDKINREMESIERESEKNG